MSVAASRASTDYRYSRSSVGSLGGASIEQLKEKLALHKTLNKSVLFESLLPQEAETTVVKLPRGPAAFCTPRINGRPPKGCHAINRSYEFTVEPCATFVKQERLRMRQKEKNERKSPEASSTDGTSVAETDAMTNSDDDHERKARKKRKHYWSRRNFRRDRAQKFGNEKRFPVLVSSKLMPQWEESEYQDSSDEEGGAGSSAMGSIAASVPISERRRTQHRLRQPTLILAVRQEAKRPDRDPSKEWKTHSHAKDVRRLCSRAPVLCREEYNPPMGLQCRETNVDNWVVSDGFKLPSIAGAKRDIAFNAPKIDEEIADARAKGQRNRDRLEVRLENRLEAYKKVQEERGPLSNFALRELELSQSGKDIVQHHTSDGDSYTFNDTIESFAQRMSIGFSRYRLSRLHLPSDVST